ncbi:hypothetical protein AMJ39_02830 [candidate division TA06 bacterium DG_24]|jgi:hypothetical protein|uniref:Uncharacterized protein n=3 Tax=Bacteria division TA06 TaxID=1156500 RepID=A0A0S8JIE0_UNCT6|nr:MAG: hypothetical protein AMJ39_02830 [candidate division TA06 bacterium DG_24]KPK68402.1 MAG: hypothetical protein AMJ82_08285 [candidate division TA06 bacterium SM23_40]KPL08604.1 MAG: hypothetical protein AMJ71_07960 [candidate division TA06 bacterium SM1_40]
MKPLSWPRLASIRTIALAVSIVFLVLAGGCSENDNRLLRVVSINLGDPLHSDIIDHGEIEIDTDDFDSDGDDMEAYGWDDSISDDIVPVTLCYSPGAGLGTFSVQAARVTEYRITYRRIDQEPVVPEVVQGYLSAEVTAGEECAGVINIMAVASQAKIAEPLSSIASLQELGGHSYYAGTGIPLDVIADVEITGEDVATGAELKASGSLHITFADWVD